MVSSSTFTTLQPLLILSRISTTRVTGRFLDFSGTKGFMEWKLGRVNCQALGRSVQRSLSVAVDTLRPDGISPPGLWYHQLFHTFQVFGGTQSSQLRVWESLCLSVSQSVQDALEMPLPTLTTLPFSVPALFPTVTWCYSLDPSVCQSILLLFLSFLLLFTTYSSYPTFLFHSIP